MGPDFGTGGSGHFKSSAHTLACKNTLAGDRQHGRRWGDFDSSAAIKSFQVWTLHFDNQGIHVGRSGVRIRMSTSTTCARSQFDLFFCTVFTFSSSAPDGLSYTLTYQDEELLSKKEKGSNYLLYLRRRDRNLTAASRVKNHLCPGAHHSEHISCRSRLISL